MGNSATEAAAIQHVLGLEERGGRQPIDVSRSGLPYDISSPPRKIEIKAFGASARGEPLPLEGSQVDAALDDPENYYLYIVDNIARPDLISVRVIHGAALRSMIDRTQPQRTFWPTFRVAEYDAAEVMS